MILTVPDVLTADELRAVQNELSGASFLDGASTAGWSARAVKKNLQLDFNSPSHTRAREIVRHGFLRHSMLQAALLPQSITTPLFNLYETGMEYGQHVDAAVMGGLGQAVRSDVAITIFLSDPRSYTGGELVMNNSGMEYAVKLEAGAAIAYPANSLHHVRPVTQGARHAAIVWVQSQVRDGEKRELLWDLDNAKRQIFSREGKSATFDSVSKSHANLLRMWADI